MVIWASVRFAELLALFGRFYAVVDGVPEQVQERLADGVNHFLIKLGLLALDGELHVLVEFLGKVAHQPFEPA